MLSGYQIVEIIFVWISKYTILTLKLPIELKKLFATSSLMCDNAV